MYRLQASQHLDHGHVDAFGACAAGFEVLDAGARGQRESGWDREAVAGHVGQAGALAAEGRPHGAVAISLSSTKESMRT